MHASGAVKPNVVSKIGGLYKRVLIDERGNPLPAMGRRPTLKLLEDHECDDGMSGLYVWVMLDPDKRCGRWGFWRPWELWHLEVSPTRRRRPRARPRDAEARERPWLESIRSLYAKHSCTAAEGSSLTPRLCSAWST